MELVFSHHWSVLQHPLGVLKFNSIWTLSPRREHHILQVKTSVPQDCPHFRCQSQVQVVICVSDRLTGIRGSHHPWVRFRELWEAVYSLDLSVYHKQRKRLQTNNSPMKRYIRDTKRASVPVGFKAKHKLAWVLVHQPESFPNPILLDSWGLHYIGMID